MASQSSSLFLVILFIFIYAASISSSLLVRAHEQGGDDEEEIRSVGRRFLLGFKETPKGSNVTFACSPSGPCVSCNSSEKRKEKYRCSETGYRIAFKCKEVKEVDKHKKDEGDETQNGQSNRDDGEETKTRKLVDDDSPVSKVKKSQSYKTYRSCVPSADEEKISVLGFESMMLGLFLLSGTAIYIRKKQTVPMLGVPGARSQSNSRF
ncbi:PREDICTED: uncharacterized protein LOC104701644 [Camelina sativa]|uniref:Uncharacterized protein LOC104701644 n=1 Tax=Camelina sativa TaxID=90675 RepID=A0ABM0SSX4_CAMSA|nr:PREDICTED: uncharacterized protein LOC104701644 [Camelina sativa]